MFSAIQSILLIFLVVFKLSSTCCSKELHLKCESVDKDHNNTRISRKLNVCHVKKFNLTKDTEDVTQLLFADDSANTYTGVSLESSKFQKFPQQILTVFPHVLSLGIAFSGMTEIEDHTFKNSTQLLDLNLGYNKITKITEFSFAGAENLVSLNLDVNQITEVSPSAFSCLPHLKILKLGSNKISTLDRNVFALLSNLRVLSLTRNPLVHIDSQMFVHNDRLVELRLSELEVGEVELELHSKKMKKLDLYGIRSDKKKITLKSFDSTDIIEIEELNLKYNRFTNISQVHIDDSIHVKVLNFGDSKFEALDEAPNFLTHAKKLMFNANAIQELSSNFLNRIKNVEFLDLSRNQLKMKLNMFEPLQNLKTLFLSGNDLRTIAPGWFTGLTKLEHLYIGSNKLSHFDHISLMNTLPSLRILNIQGGESDFKCSYLKKMVKDLKAINRLEVLNFHHAAEEEENYVYDIRCERDRS